VEKNTQPPWLDQRGAGAHDRRRVGHVLQHFHAGHHVEAAGLLRRQRLGTDLAVGDTGRLGLQGMQLGHPQRLRRQIDPQHLRALARHGVGQDAAAAADIEHPLAGQRRTDR
jgi:hypothetical protein